MVTLSEEEIKASQLYFLKKATAEIKKFVKWSNYQKISAENDKVLYYTGRILSTSNIEAAGEMPSVLKDLSATTIQVPSQQANLGPEDVPWTSPSNVRPDLTSWGPPILPSKGRP